MPCLLFTSFCFVAVYAFHAVVASLFFKILAFSSVAVNLYVLKAHFVSSSVLSN